MHHEMHQSTIVLVRSVPGSSLLPPPYWKARRPWGRGWQCFPARDTFIQQVIKAWWNVVWQQARKILPGFFFVNEHNNTNMKPQAKKKGFSKLSQKRTSSVWRENMQIIWGKYFVNHSFSGFENKNCVLISTESTVLSRSAKAYSFVAVELSTLKGKSRNITKHLISGSTGYQLVFFFSRVLVFPETKSWDTSGLSGKQTYCFPRDLTLSVSYFMYRALSGLSWNDDQAFY